MTIPVHVHDSTHLSSKVHDGVNFLRLQNVADEIQGLDATLDKLHHIDAGQQSNMRKKHLILYGIVYLNLPATVQHMLSAGLV